MYLDDPRFRVAAARRILAREGCDTNTPSLVTERASGGEAFWCAPRWMFEDVLPHDVENYDFNGEPLGGESVPNGRVAAFEFVAEIFRQRVDVRSVVHTHSPYAMALVATGQKLKMFNHIACSFDGIQTYFTQVDPSSSAIDAKLLVTALGDKSVLLMEHHGVLIAADSLEHATMLAVDFESMARVHLEAERGGGNVMPAPMVDQLRRAIGKNRATEIWAGNMRRLRRSDPDLFDFILEQELRRHGYLRSSPSNTM